MDRWSNSSCLTIPPESTTDRTEFSTRGCLVYGYPSTGGVLIKEVDLFDILFLSLPRSYISQHSPNADEEDRFYHLLRQTGATLWPSMREITDEEEKVLKFRSTRQLLKDFGRISLAMNMEEKIQMIREYGATFVEDVTQVEEL
ncbi:hypothetical protein BDV59DRAFT_194539 [Aspergillus ambiguus]|uniref:uncharacterized protein n=1 Tax=Aspergillus ambiguus TaxID=176160 RepID=UPI003CCE40B0